MCCSVVVVVVAVVVVVVVVVVVAVVVVVVELNTCRCITRPRQQPYSRTANPVNTSLGSHEEEHTLSMN